MNPGTNSSRIQKSGGMENENAKLFQFLIRHSGRNIDIITVKPALHQKNEKTYKTNGV